MLLLNKMIITNAESIMLLFGQYNTDKQLQTIAQRVNFGTCQAPPSSKTLKIEPNEYGSILSYRGQN